jgi:alpha-galactosidase
MTDKLVELTKKIQHMDRDTLLAFADSMDEKYVTQMVTDLSEITGTDDIEALRLSIGVQLTNLGIKMTLEPEKDKSMIDLMRAAVDLKKMVSGLVVERCTDLFMSTMKGGRTTESQTSDSESQKEV